MTESDLVFISYAREDQAWAERLYMDLRRHEVDAWLDIRRLPPGSDWKREIRHAIRTSRYFLLLLSKHSITKRGFIQREIKEALDARKEVPTGEIFLLPVRLDGTTPVDDELHELNWVDLLPDYRDGLARILGVVEQARPTPLVFTGGAEGPGLPGVARDRGHNVPITHPLMVGERAAIRYAPFRTAREFLLRFIDQMPAESVFADTRLSYYLTFDTRLPGIHLGEDLLRAYPEYMTLVLQHAYRDLEARESGVSVILLFGGVERTIAIPYDAIRRIDVPEIGLAIRLDAPRNPEEAPPLPPR